MTSVSLLQDARRDVAGTTEQAMLRRICRRVGPTPKHLRAMYALIGVQRSLRDTGGVRPPGSRHGQAALSRVCAACVVNLLRNLDHPALGPLAEAVHDTIPQLGPDEISVMRTMWAIPDR